MAVAYLLSTAITEICAKQKDYDEQRYGANDSKAYGRAQKLFWEAVNMLISPTPQLQTDYPEFYNFALGVMENHIFGLIASADTAIASGIITLTSLADFMKILVRNGKWVYYNTIGATGNEKYLRRVPVEKIASMAKASIVPDNTLYVAEVGNILKFFPTADTGKITVEYIKTPDNSLATSASLLTLFSMPFILKAVQLASQLLEYERMRK